MDILCILSKPNSSLNFNPNTTLPGHVTCKEIALIKKKKLYYTLLNGCIKITTYLKRVLRHNSQNSHFTLFEEENFLIISEVFC